MSKWTICGDQATYETTKGVVTIDASDVTVVPDGCIEVNRHEYVRIRKNDRSRANLHRVIMGAVAGQIVDHINHNRMDNRKANLRLCTHSQNQMNRLKMRGASLPFKGVVHSHAKRYNPSCSEARPYRAYAKINGVRVWLGYYATPEEAASAYDRYAVDNFGAFAMTNHDLNLFTRGGAA